MTDLNSINIVGRITRNVEGDEKAFGYLPTGSAKANVSLAVNRSVKKSDQWTDEVNYFDVVIFGKTAENLKKYLIKGQQIAVSGHLQQDRWEKDGKKNSKIYIVAENVQLLGGKSSNSQSSSNQQPQGQNSFNPASGFPEDIPF